MKIENENAKKLLELSGKFAEDGQTLLAIYACDDDTAGYTTTGELYKLSGGITQILDRGLSKEATEDEKAVGAMVFAGGSDLVQLNNESSFVFTKMLENLDGTDKFYVSSEKCLSCSSYIKCLKRELADVGVKIEVTEDNREYEDDDEEQIAN